MMGKTRNSWMAFGASLLALMLVAGQCVPAPPFGGNNLTLTTYRGDQPGGLAWLAFLDGAAGTWQVLEPGGESHNVPVTSPDGRYAVAAVCPERQGADLQPERRVMIVRATLAEGAHLHLRCDPPGTERVTVTTTVTGLSEGEAATVWLRDHVGPVASNGASVALAVPADGAPLDLVVTSGPLGSTLPERIDIRRGLLNADQAVDVDMGMGWDLQPGFTVQADGAGEGDNVLGVDFWTDGGTVANLGFTSGSGLSSSPYNAVPEAWQLEGDRYYPFAAAAGDGTFQFAGQYAEEPADFVLVLPPSFVGAQVAQVDTGLEARFPPFTPLDAALWIYLQVLTGNVAGVQLFHEEYTSPGYLGDPEGAFYARPFEDLSGLEGFDDAWSYRALLATGFLWQVGAQILSGAPDLNGDGRIDLADFFLFGVYASLYTDVMIQLSYMEEEWLPE